LAEYLRHHFQLIITISATATFIPPFEDFPESLYNSNTIFASVKLSPSGQLWYHFESYLIRIRVSDEQRVMRHTRLELDVVGPVDLEA
jgi:hypothetical protein